MNVERIMEGNLNTIQIFKSGRYTCTGNFLEFSSNSSFCVLCNYFLKSCKSNFLFILLNEVAKYHVGIVISKEAREIMLPLRVSEMSEQIPRVKLVFFYFVCTK